MLISSYIYNSLNLFVAPSRAISMQARKNIHWLARSRRKRMVVCVINILGSYDECTWVLFGNFSPKLLTTWPLLRFKMGPLFTTFFFVNLFSTWCEDICPGRWLRLRIKSKLELGGNNLKWWVWGTREGWLRVFLKERGRVLSNVHISVNHKPRLTRANFHMFFLDGDGVCVEGCKNSENFRGPKSQIF